jgi:nicotinic acid mononucleotide adenylyltransferase
MDSLINYQSPKYIIIAGGSYAPVHKGHLNIWKSAIDCYYNLLKNCKNKRDILLLVFPVNDYSPKPSVKQVNFNYRATLIKILLDRDPECKMANIT